MRIWAKIIKGEKILKDIIINFNVKLTETNYLKCLVEICNKLDIDTPVTLKYHYKYFNEFNMVKYIPRDFIDNVSFTSFVLENCIVK